MSLLDERPEAASVAAAKRDKMSEDDVDGAAHRKLQIHVCSSEVAHFELCIVGNFGSKGSAAYMPEGDESMEIIHRWMDWSLPALS